MNNKQLSFIFTEILIRILLNLQHKCQSDLEDHQMNPKENPDEKEIKIANPDVAGIKNAKNNDTAIISLKNTVAAPKNRTKWPNVLVRKVRIRINAVQLESKLEKSNSYVRMAQRPVKKSSWYESVVVRKIIGAEKYL